MRNGTFVKALACALLLVAAGTAHAQLNPDSVVRQVSRDVERDTGIELVERGGNGHDKCKGNGHGGSNGGSGHAEGECEEGEGETPPGPVASEVCNVAEMSPESSWSRYSCTFATYNEHYVTGTVENNESYPETVATRAIASGEDLQVAATQFLAGVENAVPLVGGPVGPGPVVDEIAVIEAATTTYAGEIAMAITAGDAEQAVARTTSHTSSLLERYVPLVGGPVGPGPVVDEAVLAVTATTTFADAFTARTTETLSGTLTEGAIADYSGTTLRATQQYTGGLADSLQRTVPLVGGPVGPGPVVDELRSSMDAIATETIVLSDAIARTVPLVGGPVGPGPVVKEYEERLPAGF